MIYLPRYGSSHPPLQRHASDFGPRGDPWDSYSGGGGRRRNDSRWGDSGSWGGRRSEDLGHSKKEDWNKPLPRNERLER